MKTTKMLLGERIKELRKSRGLTQEQFAECIGVEQKHVSRIERGKSFPTIERLEMITQALNVSMRDIFDFVHLAESRNQAVDIETMLKGLDEESRAIAYKVIRGIIHELSQ